MARTGREGDYFCVSNNRIFCGIGFLPHLRHPRGEVLLVLLIQLGELNAGDDGAANETGKDQLFSRDLTSETCAHPARNGKSMILCSERARALTPTKNSREEGVTLACEFPQSRSNLSISSIHLLEQSRVRFETHATHSTRDFALRHKALQRELATEEDGAST